MMKVNVNDAMIDEFEVNRRPSSRKHGRIRSLDFTIKTLPYIGGSHKLTDSEDELSYRMLKRNNDGFPVHFFSFFFGWGIG